jgi:uncharacterized protein
VTSTSISRARTLVGCTAVLGLVSVGLVAAPAGAATETPFISEIHYDNTGTDSGEAIEIQAALGTDLTGWSVVLYNGTNPGAATTYSTRTLSGTVTEPAGDPSGDGVVVLEYAVNGIQNGANDGMALVDAGGTVVELLSYEGSFTASNGPAAGQTAVDIGVSQNGTEPVGASLQLVDGEWGSYDTNTFGEVNDTVGGGGGGTDPEPEPELCDLTTTLTIGDVQGSGAATPLAGQEVTLRGTVTSDTPGLSGFTIQDAGDGDPATSDGIFVFSSVEVSLGDVVTVQGTATEFFTLTQVSAGTQVEVCSSGTELPAPAVLPMPSTDAEREPFESMLVTIEEELTVTGAFGLERFGEVRVSTGGILVNGTEIAEPGDAANAVEAENRTREITIDDGSNTQNLRPVPYLTLDTSLRIGDTVEDLGLHVLSYGFNQWRLQPVTGAPDQVDFAQTNPREDSPADVGGDVTVAAFNVLNYFVTLTSEDSDARGASTEADLRRQEAKIVTAINALDADVVALQEIEYGVPFGKDADVATATLVEALNADLGADVWAYVETPDYFRANPDVIQNAIIYRSDVVTPVGDSLSGGVDPDGTVWDNAREPVAQLFAAPDGDQFWVVSNHFKSKGAGGATGDNLDQGDGQGAYNADRTLQAEALAAFAAELEATDPDVFLMGDFNAYGNEDPITTLEAAGYVDVIETLDDYTYTFDQRNGNLDHGLVSEAAFEKVTGFDIWQVNAAEPFAYQYSSGIPELYAEYAFRASDHNPVVVGFDTQAPLGTDVSLADVLAQVSGPFDRNGSDYDVLGALVADVLEADPDSAVGVLADPTVALTAFLPNDDAFVATADELLPGRVPQERVAYNRLVDTLSIEQIEAILLGHVVLGQTLDSSVVVESDGASLTTAAGTTLVIDVRDDGSIAIIDDAEGNRDALLVLDAIDINLGQVQIGHTVDRVLLP